MNENIEKRRALRQREKDLEIFKITFEVDLKGNVEPEVWDLYNKCLNLEISMDEFRNKLLILTKGSSFKNSSSHYKDEIEMKVTLEDAKKIIRGNKKND